MGTLLSIGNKVKGTVAVRDGLLTLVEWPTTYASSLSASIAQE